MACNAASTTTDTIRYLSFPSVERKVFDSNFLERVIVELRYPTYLPLNDSEPTEISKAIRDRFPLYEQEKQMQMTPLGTTDPQRIYKFATRKKDPVVEISTSVMTLVTIEYKSFEILSDHLSFLLSNCIKFLETSFFTRVGLRFINHVSGIAPTGKDIRNWINKDLVYPIASAELGTVSAMRSEISGPLENGGNYTFRYGLSPPSPGPRKFVLDWDYYEEDVEVEQCNELLDRFHIAHFPFFWWALGEKAKEALENGTAC